MQRNDIHTKIIFGTLLKMVLLLANTKADNENGKTNDVAYCPQQVNEGIQRCVQPVADYAKLLNNQQENGAEQTSGSSLGKAIQLPKIGGKVFEELCKLIRQFEQCVKEHRRKCSGHITISLIEASYGYLCNDGYDTFLNSADCLMELDQQPSVKQCHDITLRNIEKANRQDETSITKKLDEMCNALNSFSGCVMNPIRTICGANAWQVIFRVLRDTTQTLMPSCIFNKNNREITSEPNAPRTRNRSQQGHHRHHSASRISSSNSFFLPKPTNDSKARSKENGHHISRDKSQSDDPQTSREGNLRYIQVEVNENRASNMGENDDFFRSSNHKRKFKNEAALVAVTTFYKIVLIFLTTCTLVMRYIL